MSLKKKLLPLKINAKIEPTDQKFKINVSLKPKESFSVLNQDDFVALIEQYLTSSIQVQGVALSYLSWFEYDQSLTQSFFTKKLTELLKRNISAAELTSKIYALDQKLDTLGFQFDNMYLIEDALISEALVDKLLDSLVTQLFKNPYMYQIRVIENILIKYPKTQPILFKNQKTISPNLIFFENPYICLIVFEAKAFNLLKSIFYFVDKEISENIIVNIRDSLNVQSFVVTLQLAQFHCKNIDIIITQYINCLLNVEKNFNCAYEKIHQFLETSKDYQNKSSFTLVVQKSISELCKGQRFIFSVLNDCLTNLSCYSTVGKAFFQNQILNRLEHNPQFQVYFSRILTLNNLSLEQTKTQWMSQLADVLIEEKHQYYKNYLETVDQHKFIHLVSEYQWNGLDSTKTELPSQTFMEVLKQVSQQYAHFGNIYQTFQEFQNSINVSSKKKLLITEMMFVTLQMTSNQITTSLEMPLYEAIIISAFKKTNSLQIEDLQKFTQVQNQIERSFQQLIKLKILVQEKNIITLNESKLIEIYSQKIYIYQRMKDDIFNSLTTKASETELEGKDETELKSILDALIVKILKNCKKLELEELYNTLQKNSVVKTHLLEIERARFEECLKGLERRELIIAQGNLIFYNI